MADKMDELFQQVNEVVEKETPLYEDSSFCFCRRRENETMFKMLERFRADGEAGFCDVFLEVEGKQIPAHRNVLAASSQFFFAMFTSSMKESSEKHLKLKCISHRATETVLKFFYSNEIVITRDNVEEVLESADFMMLDGVKNACIKVMDRVLDTKNCFKIKALAEKYSPHDLLNKVCSFIERNFSFIVKEEDFLHLEPEQLIELISSDQLLVESEEESYFAVMKWIKHNPVHRVCYLANALRVLKLGSLSIAFLQSQLETEDLIKQDKEISGILRQTITDFEDYETRNLYKRSSTHECVEVVFGHAKTSMGDYKLLNQFFCYDVSARQTFLLPALFSSVTEFQIAIVNETLYVLGGTEGCLQIDSVSSHVNACSLDFEKRNGKGELYWEEKAPFQKARVGFGTAILHGCIFTIGGTRNLLTAARTVEKYTPEENEWQFVKPLIKHRMGFCATMDENHIFAIGGAKSASAEKYDPVSNTWVQIAPPSHNFGTNSLPFACYIDGKIYALESEVRGEVYSISTDEWSKIAAPPGVVGSSFLKYDSEVYTLVSFTDKAFTYVQRKNKWVKTSTDCFPEDCKNLDDFQFYAFRIRKLCLRGLVEADAHFFSEDRLQSKFRVDCESQDIELDEDYDVNQDSENLNESDDTDDDDDEDYDSSTDDDADDDADDNDADDDSDSDDSDNVYDSASDADSGSGDDGD